MRDKPKEFWISAIQNLGVKYETETVQNNNIELIKSKQLDHEYRMKQLDIELRKSEIEMRKFEMEHQYRMKQLECGCVKNK